MRRPLLLVGLLALIALAGTGAAWAYDDARRTRIADGARIGGIDVGGMESAAAQAKLRDALAAPLERPAAVRHGGRSFRLTARQAEVSVDTETSVSRALRRSREGNFLTRAYRDLTGGRVRADVPVEVSHSRAAVGRLVSRVRRTLERDAHDAELDLSQGSVDPTPERTGRRVRTARLRREVTRTLLSRGDREPVRVRTAAVRPKVTMADLEREHPAILVVDRSAFRLQLYERLKPTRTYRIAVGAAGLETPAGLYRIQNKAENPAWNVPDSDWAGELAGQVIPPGPENPIKARWMGIYDGAGIHGTDAVDSLGTAASHGCIRMAVPDVVELYEDVPVNAPVYIA